MSKHRLSAVALAVVVVSVAPSGGPPWLCQVPVAVLRPGAGFRRR